MPQRLARRCSLRAAPASFSISPLSQPPSSTLWIAFHEDSPVALLDRDGNEPFLEAGSANTSARVGRVGRTVRRAYQMQAPDIKELAGLPVELHRHVGTTVEIRVDPAAVAHGERRLRLAFHLDIEAE